MVCVNMPGYRGPLSFSLVFDAMNRAHDLGDSVPGFVYNSGLNTVATMRPRVLEGHPLEIYG